MSEATFHPIVTDFRNTEQVTVETIEDLDQVLDRWDSAARESEPTLVLLDVGDINNHFYIGVGDDEVPLACGYSHAVGDHPPGGEPQDWAFSNTWQEVGSEGACADRRRPRSGPSLGTYRDPPRQHPLGTVIAAAYVVAGILFRAGTTPCLSMPGNVAVVPT